MGRFRAQRVEEPFRQAQGPEVVERNLEDRKKRLGEQVAPPQLHEFG